MGGRSFTIPCTLFCNEKSIDLHPLIDSGAAGFAFIDSTLASDLVRTFGFQRTKLLKPIGVKGYNGNMNAIVSECLILNMRIDNRVQLQIPFVILELGQHEIILGEKWMSHFDL